MAIVSPSILSADFGKLGADCRTVLDAGAQMLHYDVMDGHFVPNISFGVPVLKSLHKNLPDAFYDVHLMISHPLQYAEAFIKAGATLYNFHLECEDDIQATIDAVRALGCKVGLTIKPGTEPQALAPYLDQLDLVLVMSVEPGFGGQKFMHSALDKLHWLKAARAARGAKSRSPRACSSRRSIPCLHRRAHLLPRRRKRPHPHRRRPRKRPQRAQSPPRKRRFRGTSRRCPTTMTHRRPTASRSHPHRRPQRRR